MTDVERARDYIRIFIGAGARWESCIPCDGERTETGVRIGSVEIGPGEWTGTWWLRDGETVTTFAAVAS